MTAPYAPLFWTSFGGSLGLFVGLTSGVVPPSKERAWLIVASAIATVLLGSLCLTDL